MYTAPTDEYNFLLRYVLDGESLLSTIDSESITVEDAADLFTHAAALATEVYAPLNTVGDREGARLDNGRVFTAPGFIDAYRAFVAGGWLTFGLPRGVGGDAVPSVIVNAVSEMISAANLPLAINSNLTAAAVSALSTVASDDVRNVYLPHMVSGRWTATMNLTESQAGSDLGAIRAMAEPRADGLWAISGQKIFISWGDHDLTDNIVHLVLARTPDAPAGASGLSLFVVPKFLVDDSGAPTQRNQVTTVALEHKLGLHASPTCVLEYENATAFLVGEPHEGLSTVFSMMNEARLGTGIQAVGVADRSYQQAREYASQRVQGAVVGRPNGTPISDHPDVRRLLLSMSCAVTAMRSVVAQTSAYLDQASLSPEAQRLANFMIPIAKGWVSEQAQQVTGLLHE